MEKSRISWLAMALFAVMLFALSGCGSDSSASVVVPDQQKSSITIVSAKEQVLQFTKDSNGNLEHVDCGGYELKPAGVNYVVYTSWRFGDWLTSPYKVRMNDVLKLTFSNLPNNEDSYGEYYVVMLDGRRYKVELSEFEHIKLANFYSKISKGEDGIVWGDQNDPTAADFMRMTLNVAMQQITLTGQFGCDRIFGTKLGSFDFGTRGMAVAVEIANGYRGIYVGAIVQGANGNLSYSVPGIPLYADGYMGSIPTAIKSISVMMPDGTLVPFSMENNTPNNEDESVYTWYIDTWHSYTEGFGINQSDDPMDFYYYTY